MAGDRKRNDKQTEQWLETKGEQGGQQGSSLKKGRQTVNKSKCKDNDSNGVLYVRTPGRKDRGSKGQANWKQHEVVFQHRPQTGQSKWRIKDEQERHQEQQFKQRALCYSRAKDREREQELLHGAQSWRCHAPRKESKRRIKDEQEQHHE